MSTPRKILALWLAIVVACLPVWSAGLTKVGGAGTTKVGGAGTSKVDPVVAAAGIAEVGAGSQRATSGSQNNQLSATKAFPGNTTATNLLVVSGTVWGATAAPTSIAVTDTQGNSYTVRLGTVPTGMTWRNFIAYTKAGSSAADTVTVDPTGADANHSFSWSQDEFSSTNATPESVASANAESSAGSPTAGLTTLTSGELMVAVYSQDGGTVSLTPGTGWTTGIMQNTANASNQCHSFQFKLATTATGYTVDATIGAPASSTWGLQYMSFKQ